MFPHLTVSTTSGRLFFASHRSFPINAPVSSSRLPTISSILAPLYFRIFNNHQTCKTNARCDFALPRASPNPKQNRDKQHQPNQQTNQSQQRQEPSSTAPPNQQHQQSTQKPRQQPCFHCQLSL